MSEFKMDISSVESAAGTSPKSLYMLFILNLCKAFFEATVNCEPHKVEKAILALVALSVPEEKRRNDLWALYRQHRDEKNGNEYSAAVIVVGIVMAEISDVMGLVSDDWTEYT